MSSTNSEPHQPRETSDLSPASTMSPVQVELDSAAIHSSEVSALPAKTPVITHSRELLVVNKFSSSSEVAATGMDVPIIFDKFTLFPKLPAEMRCKIWFYSLPGPRVVEIDWVRGAEWVCRSESQFIPSGLLSANKESRDEFLKYYSPFLELAIPVKVDVRKLGQIPYRIANGSITYIDPTIDTLYISANHYDRLSVTLESMGALTSMECLRKLQSFACEHHEMEDGMSDAEDLDYSFTAFLPNITTVVVMVGDIMYRDLCRPNTERPRGEITFKDSKYDPAYIRSLEARSSSFSLRVEHAKKVFLDPARHGLTACFTARIFRGGAEVDLEADIIGAGAT
ncbi:hypothetical protein IFR04_006180 [Cadophora malorum]|uniref:2EXR domain-containing protein n=1 Tax=Cadophora malorum TaxID=108018 RepID=A0A8H7TK42_9HELO|nr:hypothetical protein IFR04_006180 [Cadophora malorum]